MARIVWFDTETTGLDPVRHRIIQFAAVVTNGADVLEEMELKIQFDPDQADKRALEVNHYSPEDWADAVPEIQAVHLIKRLLDRYRDVELRSRGGNPYSVARVAGHNVPFDCNFMRATFKRHSMFLPADVFRPLDTLQLALWKLHSEPVPPPDYKLETLLRYLRISVNGGSDALHDALVDVYGTMQLGLTLLRT